MGREVSMGMTLLCKDKIERVQCVDMRVCMSQQGGTLVTCV